MNKLMEYMEAMENWANARDEYRTAYKNAVADNCVSMDYFLYHERQRYNEASREMQKLFAAAVVEAVNDPNNSPLGVF